MTEEIQVTIVPIDDKSPHLDTVIALGDANKDTLSFFPKGAFREHANHGEILVALEPHAGCIGYLLYDRSRKYNRITLIHLCIAPSHRGQGVARTLVERLIQDTQEYNGIGLTCRRDYQLQDMWSGLGFVAKYDEPAKTSGKLNTYWWLDHGHLNLLSTVATSQRQSKLCAVIDPQIFFYLYTDDKIDSQESKCLLADWLQPDLDLWLTDEIFNIINTVSDLDERKRLQKLAKLFTCVPCQNQRLNEVFLSLKDFYNTKDIAKDEADLRYQARAQASQVHLFVTRDSRLLALADELYEKFKWSVISPTDLIIRLEELRRNSEYQPVRLAGTSLKKTPAQRGEETLLNDYFQSSKRGETKADFLQKLRRFIAEKDKFDCSVVKNGDNQPLALIVCDKHKKHELEIPMLRVGDNPLSGTLARHLIFQSISQSALEQRQFTRITDPCLEEAVTRAILEDRFVRVKDEWLRANIAVAETASQLSQRLSDLADKFGEDYNFSREMAKVLNAEGATEDAKTMAELEGFLWPAKIIDADIPAFIIPIQPRWAKELFDSDLAGQYLFGVTNTELALNRESVYYKSRKGAGGLKPGIIGRILWYVTTDRDRGFTDVSAVRACSRLDEVVIGKPKDLFRRFRNLGVYKWEQVFEQADNKLENDIMAIRFSDTQLLKKPVPLKKLQEILGQSSPIQSPRWISKENFTRLYEVGTRT